MRRFFKRVVAPHIRRMGYRRVCEIGAQRGVNTEQLLTLPDLHVTIVDPCVDDDLVERYAGNSRVSVCRGRSLEVIPEFTGLFDCVLIDGDHNWYTVFHELQELEARGLVATPGTIFLHDVAWPYAHRDLYYDPETIPEAYRHRWERSGLVAGQSELDLSGMNADLFHAAHEGGPRNGVWTAVQDFLVEHGDRYRCFRFEQEFGLAVLWRGPVRDWRLRWSATIRNQATRRRGRE
ncbi:MAG: class I SAM-dependent methyltransferase [Planctomycetota bacterium]